MSLPHSQKSVVRTDVAKAIAQICDSWDGALEESAARGYPTGPSAGGGSGHGDPVPMYALTPDLAAAWLGRSRVQLCVVLRASSQERTWVGSFYPPRMRQPLIEAGRDLVELWPRNTMRLFRNLYALANQGALQWPAPIRPSKQPKVLRANTVELCAECGQPIGATAADPLVRIDGAPYHKSVCYKRHRRAMAPGSAVLTP